ncbi:hypothetical protein SAMN04515618_11935 [Collimonas sp. OK307]|nr:hypothetical protein SAMN04515618_11935 [Collimonas sp. OK307]
MHIKKSPATTAVSYSYLPSFVYLLHRVYIQQQDTDMARPPVRTRGESIASQPSMRS